MTNTTIKLSDGCLTLETPAYDPRQDYPPKKLGDIKAMERDFEKWVNTTPDFWYSHIAAFEKWVDDVWDWLSDQEYELDE